MIARGRTGVLRAVTGVVLALLVLSGCQAFPTSGPVGQGLSDLRQGGTQVLFDPNGPASGATQEDIVRGFVRAASSSADDYAIARQFLTPAYLGEWDPGHGVVVDDGQRSYAPTGDAVGVLKLSAIATVDQRGTLSPARPGPTVDLAFEFERVDGEWRISSAPAGTILDRTTFTTVWSARPLYFLSADNRLVPDVRWFLNRAALTTQLVGELLLGPASDMEEVLHSAFPSGTTLGVTAVPTVDATARIDLSAEFLAADLATRDLVRRQLAASLQTIPGISRFEISVNGAQIESAAVGWPEAPTVVVERSATAVLSEGVFGTLVGGEVHPLPEIGQRIAAAEPQAVTLAPDRTSAAVLGDEGVSWIAPGGQFFVDARTDQLDPGNDRFGCVWTFSTAEPDRVYATVPGRSFSVLPLPGLAGRVPAAVRLSPGGYRIAILLSEGEQSTVLVAGVIRDAEGTPTGVSELASSELWAAGAPVDLDWIDELRLATLTRVGSAGRVTVGGVGQLAAESGSVPDGVRIAGGGRSALRVLDGSGRLFAPQGTTAWQRQRDGIELIAKVG